jgi:hypothetical protein
MHYVATLVMPTLISVKWVTSNRIGILFLKKNLSLQSSLSFHEPGLDHANSKLVSSP